MRLLDLFCGRWGWSRAFAARGWKCYGVDLVRPDEIPAGCVFIKADVMGVNLLRSSKETDWKLEIYGEQFVETPTHGLHGPVDYDVYKKVDFIVASSPCEEFSKYGMRCFFPDGPYPTNGIKLFRLEAKVPA